MFLYRPVNQAELDLIEASGWTKYPPRLLEQPIFYPVLNYSYALKINRWNFGAFGIGYITEFQIDDEYISH